MYRPILIHTPEQMDIALRAAGETGAPLEIQTPPGAAHYAGLLYLKTMIQEAAKAHPNVTFSVTVDCGEDAALAHAALREGFAQVRFSGDARMAEKLKDIARAFQAQLIVVPAQVLDLAGLRTPRTACLNWLTS